jgi:DNA-binding HxlR family transcriptional regulator
MPSTPHPNLLIALSASRWTLPLLADLAAHDGARFAELLHRLGLPRESLVRTLTAAAGHGWVTRNPGHGHPLRPEYLLTAKGQAAAQRAQRIDSAQARLGLDGNPLPRWGLPIIGAIACGHDRFNALGRWLAPATPRALSQGLVALDGQALVRREVTMGRPPASLYNLTDRGVLLADACLA